MKINFILPFKRMTGGIKVAYIYANYLVEQGHDVICYVPMLSYKGKGQSFLYRMKASLGNTIKKENWFDMKFTLKLVPVISNNFVRDADITIATAWQTAYDIANFSKSKGRKYYLVQGFETFNGETNEVENSYRLPLEIITVTEELKRQLEAFSNNISVVYNGLHDEEYIKTEKINNNPPTVMMMYHESRHKNSKEGLEILAKLKNKYPNLKVNIFGRRIPERLPEDYNILVNPDRELLLQMYRESSIYLFTSEVESWGLPIVEAMANKCAVIGRSRGALTELYDGANAIVIEQLGDMYDSVIELIENKELLVGIQNAGFKTVAQLNWENACDKFEKILVGVNTYGS